MGYKTKEERKKYHRKWYLKNKEAKLKANKLWKENNFEQYKETTRKWYLKNKETKLKANKLWKENNSKKYKKILKKWFQKNKDSVRERNKKRRYADPLYKISCILRGRLRNALKNNSRSKRTFELLGCSAEELWIHLEKTFKPGMTRKNHGKWHIDHIIPCISFDLSKPEEQAKCFHYSNLQALWPHENLSKGSKILSPDAPV
jgi:hypothetical protein